MFSIIVVIISHIISFINDFYKKIWKYGRYPNVLQKSLLQFVEFILKVAHTLLCEFRSAIMTALMKKSALTRLSFPFFTFLIVGLNKKYY